MSISDLGCLEPHTPPTTLHYPPLPSTPQNHICQSFEGRGFRDFGDTCTDRQLTYFEVTTSHYEIRETEEEEDDKKSRRDTKVSISPAVRAVRTNQRTGESSFLGFDCTRLELKFYY